MMRSLYAGISGLRNHQTRMDVIGNNIANVNTNGFKSSRVNFQDMLSQTLQGASGASGDRGGTNPVQIGMGMGVASIDTVFTDGSFQSTGKQTDLAISGQGFFVLGNGGNQVYSRAGAFDFDNSGNLVAPGLGYKVMGYKADSKGVIDTNKALETIQIPVGASMPARVSAKLTYSNNVSASATAGVSAAVVAAANAALVTAQAATAAAATATAATAELNPTAADKAAATAIGTSTVADNAAATELAAATAQNAAGSTPATVAALAAATTKKATTAAAVTAAAAATTATTPATAKALAAAMVGAATAAANEKIAASAVAAATNAKSSAAQSSINVYDTQGNAYQLDGTFEKTADNIWSFTPASTVKNAAGVTVANVTASAPISIEFNADGSFKSSTPSATITINQSGFTPPSPFVGAGAFTIKPDFSTMTQYGSVTTVAATNQDGYASGTLEKTSINPSGVIIGQFNNGQISSMAQVALANFNNPGGLGKSGESLYLKTTNSGEPQVGAAGSGGRGTFNSGALEMSNVDLAQQFSDMIVTQRGFQANSKIITTVDTMLEELVNLKR